MLYLLFASMIEKCLIYETALIFLIELKVHAPLLIIFRYFQFGRGVIAKLENFSLLGFWFKLYFWTLCGVCFFGFLLKAIQFQNLGCLFFYFFMTYYKLFTKQKKSKYIAFSKQKKITYWFFFYFLILNRNKILQKQTT